MENNTMRLERKTSATPAAVYAVLADLQTHLTWGGKRQVPGFRLTSLDGSSAPATVGAKFSSTGTIPMSRGRFADQSLVTAAEPDRVMEFTTHATINGLHRPARATYRHRYEITPIPEGAVVTYELTQVEVVNPPLRLALPVVRTMTWKLGLPFMAGRGFKNLLAMAEREGEVPVLSQA